MVSDINIRRSGATIGQLPEARFSLAPAQVTRETSNMLGEQVRASEERAFQNTYLRSQKQIMEEMDRIEKQYVNDPDNMHEAIDNFRSSFLGEFGDPELVARLDLQLERSSEVAIAKATAGRQAIIDDQARFEVLTSMQGLMGEAREVSRNIFSKDAAVSAAAQARFQEILGRGNEIASQVSSDGTPLMSAGQRFNMIMEAKDTALEGAVMSYIEQAPDKVAALKAFEDGNLTLNLPDGKGGFEPVNVRDAVSPQVERTLRAEAKRQINEIQTIAKSEVRQDAQLISGIYSTGQKVDPQRIAATRNRARMLGMNELADELGAIELTFDETQEFILNKNLQEQYDLIQEAETALSGQDVSERDLMRFKALQNAYTDKITKLQNDPVSYYESIGAIRPYANIDFSNPDKFLNEIDQRRLASGMMKNKDGVELPLLNNQEINFVKNSIKNGTPEEAAAVMQSLNSTFNVDERRKIAQTISTDAPLVAAALASEPETMVAIIEGSKAQGDVSAASVREEANLKIGGRVFDAEALEGVHSAVYAAYKKLAIDDGNTSDVVDRKLLDKAIKMVIGEPADISIGGPKSSIFSYKENGSYKTENQLERTFMALDDNYFAKTNGAPIAADGLPVSAEDIKNKVEFVTAGDGKYLLRVPGLGDLMTRNGQLYIIDARDLEKYRSLNERP